MTITVGTNSYVTNLEADTYFGSRPYSSDWTGASETDQDNALIMATRILDQNTFAGTITSVTQALAWPREGFYDQEGRTIAITDVPQAIKDAQCEMAITILRDDPTEDDSNANVRRLKAGSVEVEYDGRALIRDLPDFVSAILKPYLSAATSGDSSVRLIP